MTHAAPASISLRGVRQNAPNYQTPPSETHTHTFNGPLSRTTRLSRYTRKVKPIWILLKQETVSGSGFSWATCKSAPRSGQITTPAPHHSVFTDRMPFLPPNQQRQSTEGSLVSKTPRNVCHCDRASIRFAGKSVIIYGRFYRSYWFNSISTIR